MKTTEETMMQTNMREFVEALEMGVRPRTLPFGLKLLKDKADIPQGIPRASVALGHRVSLCQSFAFTRYHKLSLAMFKEDMVCPLGAMVLGLVEPPEYFLAGEVHMKRNAATVEAAGRIARSIFRLETGANIGAVTAPLSVCDFEIDVALVYVNSFQLGNLVLGALYGNGGRFPARVLPSAVCDVIVPPIREEKYNFNIPCGGDRRYGRATDDEILFAVPATRLGELAGNLRTCFENGGISVINREWLECEPCVPERYTKMRKDLGML